MLSLKKILAKVLTRLDSPFTIGTWTPHIYDLNTYKTTLSAQTYYKIGKLVIMPIYQGTMPAVTIGTMLQIRNFPFSMWLYGGSAYMANVSENFGNRTIQASEVALYFRPNVTGSISGGVFSVLVIGFIK